MTNEATESPDRNEVLREVSELVTKSSDLICGEFRDTFTVLRCLERAKLLMESLGYKASSPR